MSALSPFHRAVALLLLVVQMLLCAGGGRTVCVNLHDHPGDAARCPAAGDRHACEDEHDDRPWLAWADHDPVEGCTHVAAAQPDASLSRTDVLTFTWFACDAAACICALAAAPAPLARAHPPAWPQRVSWPVARLRTVRLLV